MIVAAFGFTQFPRMAWARMTARHPEWWVALFACVAWVALLARWPIQHLGHTATASGMSGMSGMAQMANGKNGAAFSFGAAFLFWLVMVVAMMGPGLLAEVRHLGFVSLGRRRNRAISAFLLGYLAVWGLLGIALSTSASSAAASWAHARLGSAVLLLGVASWQFTPAKRRALRACRRAGPPRGSGSAAEVTCIRAGATHGAWCACSCGLAMLALTIAGHPLFLMLSLTVGLAAEKVMARGTRLVPWVGVGIIVLVTLQSASR